MTLKARLLGIVVLTALLFGCRKVPDGIIQPDEMAELMADVHMGEAVVDANYTNFMTDSSRMLLKQSIAANRGFTVAQVDTSLAWYGAHLDVLHEVYERTIEILEERAAGGPTGKSSSGNRGAGTGASSGGDSINVWPGLRNYVIGPTSATQYISFNINRDSSWKPGDSYTLRGTFNNNPRIIRWNISAEYDDGSIEVLNARVSGNGKRNLTFYTDSTKNTGRVFGSIEFEIAGDSHGVRADSVELIRKPLNARTYPQRYRQKAYRFYNLNEHKNDQENNSEALHVEIR